MNNNYDCDAELTKIEHELRLRAERISKTQKSLEVEIDQHEAAIREILDDDAGDPEYDDMLARHYETLWQKKDELAGLMAESSDLVASALFQDDHHHYTPSDVMAWYTEAYAKDAEGTRVTPKLVSDILHMRVVPNAPFRNEVTSVGRSEQLLIAENMEVYFHDAEYMASLFDEDGLQGDTFIQVNQNHDGTHAANVNQRFLRLLGLSPYPKCAKQNHPRVKLFVTYEIADAMRQALNLSPQQAGV